jgi:hypothetical protein
LSDGVGAVQGDKGAIGFVGSGDAAQDEDDGKDQEEKDNVFEHL